MHKAKREYIVISTKLKKLLKNGEKFGICIIEQIKRRFCYEKFISLFLSLLLLCLMMTISVLLVNGEEQKSGDYYYRVYEGRFAVITLYTGKDEVLKIPSQLNGYTVTSIGHESAYSKDDEGAFYDNDYIKKLTIPRTIKNIEWLTFANCDNLKKVYISSTVKKI